MDIFVEVNRRSGVKIPEGVGGSVTPPNLKNSRFHRTIEDFAGHNEEFFAAQERHL